MFSPDVEAEIRAVAAARGLDPAALLAVAEVESGGKALTVINGRPMPLILFEYHVFHRRIAPARRAAAREAGLAAPKWGDIPYPRSQKARYALLERAKKIDREAAYAACSWGVGQVLGENAKWLGYPSAGALAEEAMAGVAGQLRLMLRYIERAGLTEALRLRDWARFARGYNGPGYAKTGYDKALARAWKKWRDDAATRAKPAARPVLHIGARGCGVVSLQKLLGRIGVTVLDDGAFGPLTRSAVMAFQAGADLVRDGVVGPATWARLEKAAKA